MPSERIAKCLSDILQAGAFIDGWVRQAGGTANAVLADLLIRSAIERQLLIISEAAIRLHSLDPAGEAAPGVNWSGVRGIGNIIRHRYDDLDTSIILGVIDGELRELQDACVLALRKLARD